MSTAILGVRPREGNPLLHICHTRPVPIRNAAGRVVGSVRPLNGRLALLKTVNPELHMLRHPPAWANDTTVLEQAARAGAELVCHQEQGSRRRWWAPLASFAEHGFRVARGHGEQVGLALAYWQLDDLNEPEQVALFTETAP